jgi:hypothetical protein
MYVCLLFVLLYSGHCCAQGKTLPDSFPKSAIVTAQMFLRSAFPEISSKGYMCEINLSAPLDREWISTPEFSLEIFDSSAFPEKRLKNHIGKKTEFRKLQLLNALFGFAPGGRIESLYVHSSELTSDVKMEGFRKLVNAHPEWSNSQVNEGLKKAGAGFGPADRVLLVHNLPNDALELLVGKFKIESVEFRYRNNQPSGPIAEIYWEMVVSEQQPSANPSRWSINLEPFQGRITSIIRYPSSSQPE